MPHDIYLIEWQDAESVDAWTEKDQICTVLPVIKSIGFLIRKTDKLTTLALNYDCNNESFSCIMKIPRGMILKETKIGGENESNPFSVRDPKNKGRTKRSKRV